jgi:hypothetical protein
MKLDIDAARDICKAIRRIKPGRCYNNCIDAIEKLDAYKDAYYVEGFFSTNIVHHAWLQVGRRTIDPTQFAINKLLKLEHTDDVLYFPAMRIKGRFNLAMHWSHFDSRLRISKAHYPMQVKRAYDKAHRVIYGLTIEQMKEKARGTVFIPRER